MKMLKLVDFNYYLPPELIAQEPVEPRDAARLMVLNLQKDYVEHRKFSDLAEYLGKGDILVLNCSRVLPARLMGRKETGGKVEVLLLRQIEEDTWEALVRPGGRVKVGAKLEFGDNKLRGEVIGRKEMGERLVRFEYSGDFSEVMATVGELPLPPYIKRPPRDRSVYQTVYAQVDGSVAAPTAGLHFTPGQLARIKGKGVKIGFVVLHIGIGTFRPIKSELIDRHRLQAEYFEIGSEVVDLVNQAKSSGKKVVAVGTSVVRVLESVADDSGFIRAGSGWTNLFIYPGYDFKVVDFLVTNFHLPKSTLFLLVCAFAGRERIFDAYQKAIEAKYRFLSFGDAMLIMRR